MPRLLALTVTLALLAIAGCDNSTEEPPPAGRTLTEDESSHVGEYVVSLEGYQAHLDGIFSKKFGTAAGVGQQIRSGTNRPVPPPSPRAYVPRVTVDELPGVTLRSDGTAVVDRSGTDSEPYVGTWALVNDRISLSLVGPRSLVPEDAMAELIIGDGSIRVAPEFNSTYPFQAIDSLDLIKKN